MMNPALLGIHPHAIAAYRDLKQSRRPKAKPKAKPHPMQAQINQAIREGFAAIRREEGRKS